MSAKAGGAPWTGMWHEGTASHQTTAPQEATSGLDGSREMAGLHEELDELSELIHRAPTRNEKRALHETMRSKQAEHDTHIKRLRRERERERALAQQILGRSPQQQQQMSTGSQQRRAQGEKKRRRKEETKPLMKPTGGLHWGRDQMKKLKRKARKQRKEANKKRNELKVRAKGVDQRVAGFEVALSQRMKEGRLEGKGRREEEEAAEKQPPEGGYERQQQWHDAIHTFHSTMRNLGMSVSMNTTSGIVFSNINGQSLHIDNIRSFKVDASGVTINGAPYAPSGDSGSKGSSSQFDTGNFNLDARRNKDCKDCNNCDNCENCVSKWAFVAALFKA